MKYLIAILALCSCLMAQKEITAVGAPVITGQINHAHFLTVIGLASANLTSQTPFFSGGTTSSSPLAIDTETGTGACSITSTWTTMDSVVASYKTNVIIQPAAEGNSNNSTSPCVFSQAQANAAALTRAPTTAYLPGEYVCVGVSCPTSGTYWQIQTGCWPGGNSFDNTCTSSASGSISFSGSSVVDGAVTWINVGSNAPLQDTYCGKGHDCGGCNVSNPGVIINLNSVGVYTCPNSGLKLTTAQLYNGQPVPYELPVRLWYNAVISAIITHYSGNGNIGYFRFGSPMGGELGGLGLWIWPWIGSSNGQYRAQYISWVKKFDTYIMSLSPTEHILSDINCGAVKGTGDCVYADQEAILANSTGMWGIGNQDYTILDVNNLNGTGSNNCAFPLQAGSGCTQGDWAYNFATFPSLKHELQTLTGTTPIDCATSVNGPYAPLIVGSGNCAGGFVGLMPFLTGLCSAGVGTPNVKICINTIEADTQGVNGSSPTQPAADVLLALDPSYSTSTFANSDYVSHQAAYLNAFCQFLSNPGCTVPAPCSIGLPNTTPAFGLNVPPDYTKGWDTLLNANWTCIDTLINGVLTGGACSTTAPLTTHFSFNIPANGTRFWNNLLNTDFKCIDVYFNSHIAAFSCAGPNPTGTPTTTNFGLYLPLFTQPNWGALMRANFNCIDSMLFSLLG